MGRYRKKPVVIDAVQWTGSNTAEIADFMGTSPAFEDVSAAGQPGQTQIGVRMVTVHGDTAWARPGDWIICEALSGRFYPCAGDVFAATYDPVT